MQLRKGLSDRGRRRKHRMQQIADIREQHLDAENQQEKRCEQGDRFDAPGAERSPWNPKPAQLIPQHQEAGECAHDIQSRRARIMVCFPRQVVQGVPDSKGESNHKIERNLA